MNKILKINEAVKLAKKLRKQNKTIVLTGGFFDILHPGHIKFLENAKKRGDYLFVLLEDDDKAKSIKGKNRPINSQKDRAIILSAFQNVDFIVMLKNMTSNAQYDKLIFEILPNVIAATYGDPYIYHKKRQAEMVNRKVIFVTKRILAHSTTRLIELADKKSKENL